MSSYREFPASQRLAPYVECYWWRKEHTGAHRISVLPDGCVDILFSTRNGEPLDLSVVGLMTTARTVSVPAGQSFFGVRFRPGMAAAFIEQSAFFQDKVESLENVWGGTARSIHEQLAELHRHQRQQIT